MDLTNVVCALLGFCCEIVLFELVADLDAALDVGAEERGEMVWREEEGEGEGEEEEDGLDLFKLLSDVFGEVIELG